MLRSKQASIQPNAGFGTVSILIAVIVISAIGFVGWRIHEIKSSAHKGLAPIQNKPTAAKPLTLVSMQGWKEYGDERLSLEYPSTLVVERDTHSDEYTLNIHTKDDTVSLGVFRNNPEMDQDIKALTDLGSSFASMPEPHGKFTHPQVSFLGQDVRADLVSNGQTRILLFKVTHDNPRGMETYTIQANNNTPYDQNSAIQFDNLRDTLIQIISTIALKI